MSIGCTHSVALQGLAGNLVEVEVDIADGIPSFSLLGLPDAALSESRDRVRAALINCQEPWPNKKVTVSLSPAWLPKSGSGFDLSIALALLIAQQSIPQEPFLHTIVLGELALDGKVRPIQGVLPALIEAFQRGIRRAVIPFANRAEALLLPDMKIIEVRTLAEVTVWARNGIVPHVEELDLQVSPDDENLDFADVAGQPKARDRKSVV